ncbi:MAG: hypothetical protein HYR67_05950, partial [Bacteroidetes bacterium]|nr:hypothetical protein [Bacteroidota bacterium]
MTKKGSLQGGAHFTLADALSLQGGAHFALADALSLQGGAHFALADALNMKGGAHFAFPDSLLHFDSGENVPRWRGLGGGLLHLLLHLHFNPKPERHRIAIDVLERFLGEVVHYLRVALHRFVNREVFANACVD